MLDMSAKITQVDACSVTPLPIPMASSKISDSKIDPKLVLSHKFPEYELTYCERDVAIYALGVGACNSDAVDTKELHYVCHRNGQPLIKVLPTFVSLFPFKNSNRVGFVDMPGLHYDPKLLLHGQQYIELYRPIPSSGTARQLLLSLKPQAI